MDKIGRRTSIDSEEFDLACRCFAQIQHSTLMFRVQLCPFYVVEMSHQTILLTFIAPVLFAFSDWHAGPGGLGEGPLSGMAAKFR
jgi:hypothetical protein